MCSNRQDSFCSFCFFRVGVGWGGWGVASLPLVIDSFENMLLNNFNERVTLLILKRYIARINFPLLLTGKAHSKILILTWHSRIQIPICYFYCSDTHALWRQDPPAVSWHHGCLPLRPSRGASKGAVVQTFDALVRGRGSVIPKSKGKIWRKDSTLHTDNCATGDRAFLWMVSRSCPEGVCAFLFVLHISFLCLCKCLGNWFTFNIFIASLGLSQGNALYQLQAAYQLLQAVGKGFHKSALRRQGSGKFQRSIFKPLHVFTPPVTRHLQRARSDSWLLFTDSVLKCLHLLLDPFFLFFMFIFERETERKQRRGRERKTQNPKHAPGSELLAQSLTWGSNSRIVRS